MHWLIVSDPHTQGCEAVRVLLRDCIIGYCYCHHGWTVVCMRLPMHSTLMLLLAAAVKYRKKGPCRPLFLRYRFA